MLLFGEAQDKMGLTPTIMIVQTPEPWLRGNIPGIGPYLQPVAHALVHSLENVTSAVADLSQAQLWLQIKDVASIGFHLRHLAGSTDRLMTYALGRELSEAQRASLANESNLLGQLPTSVILLQNWESVVERALQQLKETPEASLAELRLVGRAQFPSTVLGLLFHAAEHTSRHTGQIVTTSKLVRSAGSAT